MNTSNHQEANLPTIENERDLFFSYSFDLMGVVGTDGFFKRVNPAFEVALGYSQEELCAQPLVDFLHPEDVEKTNAGIRYLAEGNARIGSVNRYRCKDGKYRWFSWNTMPMGSLLYAIGRDITEQVLAEERIKRLNVALESKNAELEKKNEDRIAELRKSEGQVLQLQKMDAIGRLAGGIAHDFNNMLSAISMYCDLLGDDAEKPEAVRENVRDIRDVTSRAAALTRQLLIFSRKQTGMPQTLNLNPLIQQLEKMLARLIGENIRIATKLAADLKTVNADPSQMEQVVLNLVVNAKDAMPRGGTITVETSNVYLDESFTSTHLEATRGHYVLLSISDDGVGMDAATRAKIFEPFFTTKPVGKGTGLGLSTTYGIVKQSMGTIWVYSEIGKGTVIKIYLPVSDRKLEEPKLVAQPRIAANGNQTILLVEDDERLRLGLSLMLQRRGYQVLQAADGNEAVAICERHHEPIHLLLSDVIMPGVSGFELAMQILPIRPELQVLFMSGYTSDTLESSGIEDTETLNFLQKPFDTNGLVSKVQEVLSKRDQAQRS